MRKDSYFHNRCLSDSFLVRWPNTEASELALELFEVEHTVFRLLVQSCVLTRLSKFFLKFVLDSFPSTELEILPNTIEIRLFVSDIRHYRPQQNFNIVHLY